jgi:hypothetical protein
MNSSTPEKAPKLDKHIGYAKFKKTKTYIVRVDYIVTAKNINDARYNHRRNAGIEKLLLIVDLAIIVHIECPLKLIVIQ